MSSPVYGFIQDYCDDFGTNYEASVEVDLLYEAWKSWTATQNIRPGIRPLFLQRVRSLCPNVIESIERIGEKDVLVYKGITLKEWVEKEIS